MQSNKTVGFRRPKLATGHWQLLAAGRRERDQRGVLLLVVLSLLVLFALITMTFVMVARQYRTSSRYEGKAEQRAEDHRKLLDSMALTLLRGQAGNKVAIPDGLLGDMYGYDSLKAQLTNPTSASSGQFIQFEVTGFDSLLTAAGYPATSAARSTGGYFNGCVLTFLTGPLKGESTRIVGFRNEATTPSAVPAAFQVMAVDGKSVLPNAGDQFLINGRPFNGAGQGFNIATGKLDATEPGAGGYLYGLLANGAEYNTTSYMPGGPSPDEDYDAPDLHNLHLAYLPATITSPADIIPSFHRPDLIAFWQARTMAGSWDQIDPNLLRKIMIRPSSVEHFVDTNGNGVRDPGETLDFTGKVFNAITGPWDIDNDGDGVFDSVWVDLGVPVTPRADGRLVKPLFGVLCIDLDGRLNVNAHGNLAQVDRWNAEAGAAVNPDIAGGATTRELLFGGEGYGPAEINLRHTGLWTATDYEILMAGKTVGPNQIEGRYGELGKTPRGGYTRLNAGDTATDPRTGTLAEAEFSEFPPYNSPPPATLLLTSFSSLPNLWGRRPMVLDWRGMPYFDTTVDLNDVWRETQNNPYEIDLSRSAIRAAQNAGGEDSAFTVAELERVLRLYDVDQTSLPARLQTLLGLSNAGLARMLFTTDSWDVPSPSLVLRKGALGAGVERYASIADLYYDRLDATVTNKAAELAQMLPPEMMSGLRFDINRPFGNGRDDDGNSVVDEPQEAAALGTPEAAFGQGPATFTAAAFWHSAGVDVNGDGTIDGNNNTAEPVEAYFSRHLAARYMYCLAMFLRGPSTGTPDMEYDYQSGASADETAEALAQWAVNVIDFRDRDAIMTAFEYDKNPFNGWSVDGDPLTTEADSAVVWGCERPELLITETLAWHDRRTEDLTNETPDGGGNASALNLADPNDDQDYDQRLQPEGRFFMELYNPWASTDGPHGELHAAVGGNYGVDLRRTAPGGQPVWRVIVANGETLAKDLDASNATERLTAAEIDRSIYFTQPPNDDVGVEFYVDPADTKAINIAPILPGRYAVIGSADELGGSGDYYATVGRTTSANESNPATLTDNTRQIVMSPDASPAQSDVVIRNNRNGTNEDVASVPATPAGKFPSVAVIVNGPRPLSVSEPATGYPAVNDPVGGGGQGAYNPPRDTPLDIEPALRTNGVAHGYKTVYLQRLANPLLKWNPDAPHAQHDATAPLNPYRTIDVSSVDLTAFNGVANDSTDPAAGNGDKGVASFERGENNGVGGVPLLWRVEPQDAAPAAAEAGAGTAHYFNYNLNATLGYLNKPWTITAPAWTSATATGAAPAPSTAYIGSPSDATKTLTWMTWNNRPFANVLEISQVPRVSSWRLIRDFSPPTGDPYALGGAANTASEFGHLFNFFNTIDGTNFSRILDFVQVPSRFVGTDKWLSPNATNGFGKVQTYEDQFWQVTHPPFNRISSYRDPGLININTISDDRVWKSVMDNRTAPTIADIVASRRGVAGAQTAANPDLPSFFFSPFRSTAGAELRNSLVAASGGAIPTTAAPDLADVDATILRRHPTTTAQPLLVNTTIVQHGDPTQNPYFRYETLQRLSSMVTTRSNVYAVWVTVGYFEVDANGKLRQEVGADTGEISRHRAFYIFDRTIPVGYERGEDHNVEKAILLRRFIE